MTDNEKAGLFGIVHTEEEKKRALERLLRSSSQEKEEDNQNNKGGLVIGDNALVKLYDFATKKFETIAEISDPIRAFAYHDNALWISYIANRNNNENKGIISLKNDRYLHIRNISHTSSPHSFFFHKGTLFDTGMDGMYETVSRKEHITKENLNKKRIYSLDCIIYHEGMILALAELKDTSYVLYELHEKNGQFSIGNVYMTNPNKHNKLCQANSVHGKIVTTLPLSRLDINNAPIEETFLSVGEYKRIVFDPASNILYAGGEINAVKRFKVTNKDGNLEFEKLHDIVDGTLQRSNALLLITQDQMENIRRLKR